MAGPLDDAQDAITQADHDDTTPTPPDHPRNQPLRQALTRILTFLRTTTTRLQDHEDRIRTLETRP